MTHAIVIANRDLYCSDTLYRWHCQHKQLRRTMPKGKSNRREESQRTNAPMATRKSSLVLTTWMRCQWSGWILIYTKDCMVARAPKIRIIIARSFLSGLCLCHVISSRFVVVIRAHLHGVFFCTFHHPATLGSERLTSDFVWINFNNSSSPDSIRFANVDWTSCRNTTSWAHG